ncbi:hypothetical protein Ancab_031925 [Ancistrocladus abbreviatus]
MKAMDGGNRDGEKRRLTRGTGTCIDVVASSSPTFLDGLSGASENNVNRRFSPSSVVGMGQKAAPTLEDDRSGNDVVAVHGNKRLVAVDESEQYVNGKKFMAEHGTFLGKWKSRE